MKGCFHRSEMWVTVGGSDSVGSQGNGFGSVVFAKIKRSLFGFERQKKN